LARLLEPFQPKWKPVRRRKCDQINETRAFSAEVETGSAQKMRPNQRHEGLIQPSRNNICRHCERSEAIHGHGQSLASIASRLIRVADVAIFSEN
jgi:hypothetical protein